MPENMASRRSCKQLIPNFFPTSTRDISETVPIPVEMPIALLRNIHSAGNARAQIPRHENVQRYKRYKRRKKRHKIHAIKCPRAFASSRLALRKVHLANIDRNNLRFTPLHSSCETRFRSKRRNTTSAK